MRGAWVTALVMLSTALLPRVAASDVFVISDFETQADLDQWEGTGAIVHCPEGWCEPMPAALSRVAAHATSGSYSCLIEMSAPPVSWPGMNLISFPITDWSAYDVLRMDFHNPNSFALLLHVEISDSVEGSAWAKRFYKELTLIPGSNEIQIDLHNLPRNDGTGEVDSRFINRFLFYGSGFSAQTEMHCDYVRLETVQDDPWADAAFNIYKFDFGTATSARWPDFFRVTEADSYAASPGWGWSGGDSRYSADLSGPDDLCRDCVRYNVWWGTNLEMDFRLDLPDDTYGVYVIARSGEWHGMPVRGWQAWSEGVLEADVPMDSSTFYSDSYYYRGMEDDYPPSVSYWERYVDPNFPAYSFTTTVSDGHLDLKFVDCWVYTLIVYPTSASAEMNTRIAGWEAERRSQFEAAYYVNEPAAATFTPTPVEAAREYAAWPVAALEPCHPDTLPPDPRPVLELSAKAARGETRAVNLAVRPLSNLTDVWLEVSDLSDGNGHVIPSSAVECRHVRYLAGPNSEFFSPVLYWKPHLVQDNFPLEVPAQTTKQFWIEVRVPEGAAGGTYAGTVVVHTSAADLSVPLAVEVWGFELDAADDMSYGWYYMPPDERYCFKDFPGLAGAGDDMLRLDFDNMKEHGFNAIQLPTPECWAIDAATGWVDTLNMSELDRYVAAMNDTGFGGVGHDQVGTLSIANQILGHSSVAEFDSNFNASFKDCLARMVGWSNTDGVPLVMYLVDEPRETGIQPWNRNFADTMQYCTLASEVPGVTSTVTLMADSDDGVDYTPIVGATDVLQTHPWSESAALIAAADAQGKPKWFYNTWDQGMWTGYRWGDLRLAYGYWQYAHGNGCWNWHFDWLDGDIWDPFPYSPFNNHWHFTYPSPDGPVPTLKYKWGSQGITDYRYAKTLNRLSGEARASGTPTMVAWADEADALLQALRNDIPDYPVDADVGFAGLTLGDTYLADLDAALDDYRCRIGALIARYGEPIPGEDCEVESCDLPDAMTWQATAAVSITYRNLTTIPWLGIDGYRLLPADGADRWCPAEVPLTGDVPAGETHAFEFVISSPPWTTLRYPAGATDTTPAVPDGLPCDWMLVRGSDLLHGGLVAHSVAISRFPDIQPGSATEWARTQIEECAGRVPFIVQGYSDGHYHGDWTIARDAMAVFIARAANYHLHRPDLPTFPDVLVDHWAAGEIQACVDNGVVQGYPDGSYRPGATITRDQMAVFIQRATDLSLPVLTVAPFADVPTGFWAAPEIQACVDSDIVKGYTDGFYRPRLPVTRDQMAVFIYRAFVQPTASVVLLAGPGLTSVTPAAEVILPGDASFYGWPHPSQITAGDPGTVYLVLDAARLDSALAGPATWDVTFTVRNSAGEAAAEHTISLSAADLVAARQAVSDSGGCPYLTLAWDLPFLSSMMAYTIDIDSTSGSITGDEPLQFGIGDAV